LSNRDGDRDIPRSISVALFFLLFSLALHASEYLISYQYTVKDAILYNESLQIAKSMKKCKGIAYNPIIFKTQDSKNLEKIINTDRERFIEYIHKLGLYLKHSETTSNAVNSSMTFLTLKTTCFKVDFNDTFVRISPLK